MDMRKYSGASWLKKEDVSDGPLQRRIAAVSIGKFEKPDVLFETGDKLSLNATNNHELMAAYGLDSDDWIGHVIELFLGEGEFQGKSIEMIRVRAISKPKHYGEQKAAKPVRQKPKQPPAEIADEGEFGASKSGARKDDVMDDEIPF